VPKQWLPTTRPPETGFLQMLTTLSLSFITPKKIALSIKFSRNGSNSRNQSKQDQLDSTIVDLKIEHDG
jgi:hypothetical protein